MATFDKYILKNQSHRNNIYQIKESLYSSHSQINRYLKKNTVNKESVKILDVGSGEGTVNVDTKLWSLYGIDNNDAIINHNYHRNYLVEVDDYQNILKLKLPKFDFIIFADILEHLVDPEKTLIFYSRYLKKNGLIIISVPNIANIYIRLMLLFGIFNYTDRGILDRTHLKFFTNKSLHQLCQNVGYIIKEKMTTPIPLEIIFPGLIKVKKQHFLTKLIYKLTSLRPSLFGYQFIVVICKDK